MPILNASIPVGATFAPTGGTARTLKALPPPGAGFTRVLVDDGAAYNIRNYIDVYAREPIPRVGLPGGFQAARRSVFYYIPEVLSDGSVFINQLQTIMFTHPETPVATIDKLRSYGNCGLNDTDFIDLWNYGANT